MVDLGHHSSGRGRRLAVVLSLATGLGLCGLALAKRAPPVGAGANFNIPEALLQAQQTMAAIDVSIDEANTAQAKLLEDGKMAKLEEAKSAARLLEKLVGMASRAYQALQMASAKGDGARSEREFVKITVAYQRILDIVARIKAAAGTTQTSTIDGSPELDIIRDADLPTDDPNEDIGLINTLDVDTGRPPATTPIN